MVHTIEARNVNGAYASALHWLRVAGVRETSRNGDVLVAPGPVITTYHRPWERVLFSPIRDANPFFHLMESLWMLSGRDTLEFPVLFNKRFSEYSDDGVIINGAYGYRWRKWFGYDQLEEIVKELRASASSRRAVLSMWDGDMDLRNTKSKDIPCNTHAYFDLRNNALNMTVCNRSNDAVWGAYGANAVHFSVLQEYLAAHLSVKIGEYRQFSNNLHVYTEKFPEKDLFFMAQDAAENDRYTSVGNSNPVTSLPLVADIEDWDRDLHIFMTDPSGDYAYTEPFFLAVAVPMYAAWMERKAGTSNGLALAESIAAEDWRDACTAWIKRREKA